MSKTQLKLMAALSLLVILVVGVSGVLAERGLRTREMRRIGRSLEERAELARELVQGIPFEREAQRTLDAVADRAGSAAGARVTLIAPDGTVVGDSDVALGRLAHVANHGDRPEVQAARAGAVGHSARHSETVGRHLFYLAVPVSGGSGGVVRLAVDLSDLEGAVADLRRVLFVAGIVGLGAAVGLSYVFAWITLRPIRKMRRLAASIAGGDLDARLPRRQRDELGDISRAINQMALQLRLRLGEVTTEKEQLQAVLNGMAEGVLVVDAKGEVLLANARLREFFDVWGDVLGRRPIEVFRDAELAEVLSAAERGDEAVSREIAVERGTPRTLRVQAVRFPGGRGERMGTVAVLHDITELMRLESVRRDFVANASHELRTPLAAIRGFAETLLASTGLSPDARHSYLEVIDRHSRRLGNIVDDLLTLSKIESRQMTLRRAEVDLEGLVRSLVRDGSPRFVAAELEVDVHSEGSPLAWSDPRAVEHVLTNLLDNAVKYTEPGGRIDVTIDGDERFVRVRVSDTGLGIPEGDLERIFERFYRVDKARSRELGGTGLGLSIVRHLVQNLGGDVSVESELGTGSTFTFTLPRPGPQL